jgi:hypothetical protein
MANFYLLGNGFDIHHKLPTRYIDMVHICSFLLDNGEKKYEFLSDLVEDYLNRHNDTNIKEYYDQYQSQLKQIRIDSKELYSTISILKNNCWFKYIGSLTRTSERWVDFEIIIQKILKLFESLFRDNEYSLQFSPDNCDNHEDIEYSKTVYIKRFAEYFDNVVGNYDERRRGLLFRECFIKVEEMNNAYVRYDFPQIVNNLYEHLDILKKVLKYYLTIFVNTVLVDVDESYRSTHVPFLGNFDLDNDHIITLNYTSTVEYLYGIATENVHHYHGDLHSQIVMGINASSEDENNETLTPNTQFIKFKKYYQRFLLDTDSTYSEMMVQHKEKQRAISEFNELLSDQRENSIPVSGTNNSFHLYQLFAGSDLVSSDATTRYEKQNFLFVIGHSLDITDAEIIIELFNECDYIQIYYHNQVARGDYIENLIRIFGKTELERMRKIGKLEFKSL